MTIKPEVLAAIRYGDECWNDGGDPGESEMWQTIRAELLAMDAEITEQRTHHAEIAEAVEAKVRIEVIEDRLLTLVSAIKQAGGDPLKWTSWTDSELLAINDAMHNSARDGE